MNWSLLTPEISVASTAALVLILDFCLPARSGRKGLGILSLLGIAVALVATLTLFGSAGRLFGGVFAVDTLALFFKVVFLLAAALVLLSAFSYLERRPGQHGEFYWLLLTALLGMMVTAAGRELITIYVGIELISLSFCALMCFRRDDAACTEAALKYFLLSCFSIGLWLYGAALLFGLTGSTDLAKIAEGLKGAPLAPALLALFLLLAGFGFKMGLAPFHMWIPDTYEGAPTPVTAYLAVGSKAAGFAVFLRVMATSFGALYLDWAPALGVLAALTMTWGNVAALFQTNMKRLLAYSGVAHAGYTLVGVLAFQQAGAVAVLFYLFGYLFANLGAFAAVIAFSNLTGREEIAGFAGLHRRSPFLALSLALCLLSLAGLPPLAGFFGKLFLFWGAVQQGGWLLTLVVIAALNSAISLYYYVNVIRTMYFLDPVDEGAIAVPPSLRAGLLVALAGVLLAAFYFQPVLLGITRAAGY